MPRPFDLFKKLADVIEVEAGPHRAEVTCLDDKRRPVHARRCRHQSAPERLVHHIPKRPTRAPRLGLQLGRHVVVERQGRAHIMMLINKHHDVNDEPSAV